MQPPQPFVSPASSGLVASASVVTAPGQDAGSSQTSFLPKIITGARYSPAALLTEMQNWVLIHLRT